MSTALAASFLSNTIDGGSLIRSTHANSASEGGDDILLDESSGRSGQRSLPFICTVCSTMMGSTLMSLPWAFQNAGLVASLIMISLVAVVSYYTCFLILRWGAYPLGNFSDFSDLCCHYLGTWSRHVANGTSVGVCVGVCTIYHVLMASSLQAVVSSIGDLAGTDVHFFCCGSGDFEYALSSIIIAVFVFPLMCFRTINRLMRIGSYCGIAVLYNVVFIIGNAVVSWPDSSQRSNRSVKLVGTMKDFGVFFGTLGLSLFIHSMLLQMGSAHCCSTSRPSVVKRDVAISYVLAVVFYLAVGAVPAVAFELGGQQYKNSKDGLLPQNILLAYDHSNWGAIVARCGLVLQILIVYPLLGTVIRGQFYSSIMSTAWPGWPLAILFNVGLVTFTTLISSVYPKPGNVVGYVGVYTAIIYMLALPFSVHLKARKAANRASLLSTAGHVIAFVVIGFAFLMQFIF